MNHVGAVQRLYRLVEQGIGVNQDRLPAFLRFGAQPEASEPPVLVWNYLQSRDAHGNW